MVLGVTPDHRWVVFSDASTGAPTFLSAILGSLVCTQGTDGLPTYSTEYRVQRTPYRDYSVYSES